jgi:hypothetical protein
LVLKHLLVEQFTFTDMEQVKWQPQKQQQWKHRHDH